MKKDEHILNSISQTSIYPSHYIISLFDEVESYDDIIMLIELGVELDRTPDNIYSSIKMLGVSVKDFYCNKI